jgi:hypothetical protein
MPPVILTIREHIAWSYANLAMAWTALDEGAEKYTKVHYSIRSRLYNGLSKRELNMGSLYDDERLKMTLPKGCCYCGAAGNLTLDHLLPRIRGGPDDTDNLVWACKACNSSKQGVDLLVWMARRSIFPPILVLRRYIKLVARYCDTHCLMETSLDSIGDISLPFDLHLLPYQFPTLDRLVLWVHPATATPTVLLNASHSPEDDGL